MSSSWTDKVQHVVDGERVEAKVDSRPTRALENQARYLKERVDGIENKSALVAYDCAVEPDVVIGNPVYWNGPNARFEKALAGFEFNRESRILETSPLSEVIGIVSYKHTSTIADILISGKGKVNISGVLDQGNQVVPGRYYLSGKSKGHLSTSPAIADIAVLVATGEGEVYVQPQLRDGPYNHVHYEFDLTLSACGNPTIPEAGAKHAILNVDTDMKGWLPAGDSSFNGLAPKNAIFGYNLKTHIALNNVFPPMPAESASLTLFKSDTDGNGVELPLGSSGLAIIDMNGIWWTSDCYNDVPWAYGAASSLSSSSSASASSSSSSSYTPECPRDTSRRILLRFAKSSYGVDKTVVTSLDAIPGSGLTILGCYDNNPTNTGALKIGLDLGLQVDSETEIGSLVFKNVTGNKFKRGRVLEGIKAGDGSVTLASTITRREVVGDNTSALIHQGIVSVVANIEPAERIFQPQVVRLSDAKERYYQDIMYLALPSVQASSIRLKVLLPHADAIPSNPRIKLRLRLLGRSSGTLPALTVTYRILAKSSGSNVALPLSDTAVNITTNVSISTDTYIDIDSAAISGIAGQDIIFFTLARAAADAYAGEVGVLEAVTVLYSA